MLHAEDFRGLRATKMAAIKLHEYFNRTIGSTVRRQVDAMSHGGQRHTALGSRYD